MKRTQPYTLALATTILLSGLATAQPPRPGGPGGGGPGGPNGAAQAALDKLRLKGSALDKAQDALDAHNRVTRKMLDRTRLDLLAQVKQAVDEKQYLLFKDAVSTGPGRQVTTSDLVEHVMAFDTNNVGMVCKGDLPERMQHLVDKGDLNKDGYLDREELHLLALKAGTGRGPGGPGGGGPGGGGPGGGVRAFNAADADRALKGLSLTGEPVEKIRKAIDTFKDASRKVTDERRTDLIVKMKSVLSDDQHRQFSEALSR